MKLFYSAKDVEEIEEQSYRTGVWVTRHMIINLISDKAALNMDPSLLELVDQIRDMEIS